MIPGSIKIKRGELPDAPGVYLYFDALDRLLYVGKATSLKRRVSSYWSKAHERRIEEMVAQIARIDYIETPTVIEALVLEANKIKALRPKYNILARDDKSFMFLVITSEKFPKPLLIRGHELRQMGVNPWGKGVGGVGRVGGLRGVKDSRASGKFLRIFGPYTSSHSLKIALDLIRKIIPWSTCEPPEVTGRMRGCFNSQIGKCPGVCTGKISQREYIRYIRQLITFFDGKKLKLERELEREMKKASEEMRFEDAAIYRRRLGALQHIQDIALLSKEDHELPFSREPQDGTINLEGRIEAYDISNISGTSATGSMVVFEEGKPAKEKYRKFKISGGAGSAFGGKTTQKPNDVAMMEEMIRRRLKRGLPPARLVHRSLGGGGGGIKGGGSRSWDLPQIMVIDGGLPQVNRVQAVLDELGVKVPIIGIAKGFDRKHDRLVFDRSNEELTRVATRGKELFQKARDEAHRFAIKYHRELRSAPFKKKRP